MLPPLVLSCLVHVLVWAVPLGALHGKAHPQIMQPPNPPHLHLGLQSLALGCQISLVQHGVQEAARPMGVQIVGQLEAA